MTCPLLKLPPELVLQIYSLLPPRQQMRLGTTCKQLWPYVPQEIIQAVRDCNYVINDPKRESNLLTMYRSKETWYDTLFDSIENLRVRFARDRGGSEMFVVALEHMPNLQHLEMFIHQATLNCQVRIQQMLHRVALTILHVDIHEDYAQYWLDMGLSITPTLRELSIKCMPQEQTGFDVPGPLLASHLATLALLRVGRPQRIQVETVTLMDFKSPIFGTWVNLKNILEVNSKPEQFPARLEQLALLGKEHESFPDISHLRQLNTMYCESGIFAQQKERCLCPSLEKLALFDVKEEEISTIFEIVQKSTITSLFISCATEKHSSQGIVEENAMKWWNPFEDGACDLVSKISQLRARYSTRSSNQT